MICVFVHCSSGLLFDFCRVFWEHCFCNDYKNIFYNNNNNNNNNNTNNNNSNNKNTNNKNTNNKNNNNDILKILSLSFE